MDLLATLRHDLADFAAEAQRLQQETQQIRQALAQREQRLVQLAGLQAHLGQRVQEAEAGKPTAAEAGHGV